MTNNKREYPTYEIDLPLSFDLTGFSRNAEQGIGKFWLICLDAEPGIKRFKGVVMGENVRVFIDIISNHQKSKNRYRCAYVTTPWYQTLSAREVAKIVMSELKGLKMYHDGVEVEDV